MFSVPEKLLIFQLLIAVYAQSPIETYYWKDFKGLIPKDALECGLDYNGKPIYVGQTLYEGKLIPVKVFSNEKVGYFEWYNQEKTVKDNIKILCTDQPQQFEWILTKKDDIRTLSNRLLVIGGFEPNYSTYIGRANVDGETSVGKVMCGIDNCLGLYITKGGKGSLVTSFEILSYNPKIPSVDPICNPDINIRIN